MSDLKLVNVHKSFGDRKVCEGINLTVRDGEMVQYVPLNKRAWHAGVSCYENRDCCNDYSIGIELEGEDETPYTEQQYLELSKIIKALIKNYPDLNEQTIAGHNDIAPGRKTDPGEAFDWSHLRSLL